MPSNIKKVSHCIATVNRSRTMRNMLARAGRNAGMVRARSWAFTSAGRQQHQQPRNLSTSAGGSAPTSSTSFEKMQKDKRYTPANEVPEEVLANVGSDEVFSPGFSIKGQAMVGRASYLDMQATTPMDPRALDAMMSYQIESYGNPHSRTHSYGWDTEAAVEKAREQVADLIGASPKEIIFTSGATESNNMSIKGVARFYKGRKKHLITTQTEHKCVLDSCRAMEQEGYEVTYLPVERGTGLVDLEELRAAIRPDTVACSVMAVNNEIGVVQPLKEIGEICRENKVFFHSDIAQMLGKMPINVNDLKMDLASLSSHKIYGPKGVGALYIRRRPRVRLEPVFSGGGQERVAWEEMDLDKEWVDYLSKRMRDAVMSRIPEVTLNGDPEKRYPGNLNFSFAYVEGESLLMALKNIAVSSGSACTSASLEPSYVLRAIGVEDDLAHTSMRFGIGRFTTEEEVDFAVESLAVHVERLRSMSPLWEMVQEGIDIKSIQWSQDAH